MPHLRASALKEDRLGCALLLQVLHGTNNNPSAQKPTSDTDPLAALLLETRLLEAQRERQAAAGATSLAPRQKRHRLPSLYRSIQTKRSA